MLFDDFDPGTDQDFALVSAHVVGEDSSRAKKAASRGPLSCFSALLPSKRVPSSGTQGPAPTSTTTMSSPDDDNWQPDQHDPNLTPRGSKAAGARNRSIKADNSKANLL